MTNSNTDLNTTVIQLVQPDAAPERYLSETHRRMLVEESGIDPATIDARGYFTATRPVELTRLGFTRTQARVPALGIPIRSTKGEVPLHQIRPDQPRVNRKGKPVKYDTRQGARMVLDVPPSVREDITDRTKPLYITEGSKKADALASRGCCTVGLLGVYGWRGKDAQGNSLALGDWEDIALNDRDVYIVFDSDVMVNPQVYGALRRLSTFLETRRARVWFIYIPASEDEKIGVDDFFATGKTVEDLMQYATQELRPPPRKEGDPSSPYRVEGGGLCMTQFKLGGEIDVPLTNFSARIVTDILIDDGLEQQRRYIIEGCNLGHKSRRFEVPASEFATLSWVPQYLGSSAIVNPGTVMKDHVRAAIQFLSLGKVEEQTVYAHLGWRKIDGEWVYLHNGGAIGAAGLVDTISIQLPEALSRYELPAPPEGAELDAAVAASLAFLNTAPLEVTVPLYGILWRSVLQGGDFGGFLAGRTGQGKTALAALLQQHSGPQMDARQLPTSWESTENVLEELACAAKDALMIIDEFVPSGANPMQVLQRKAERVFRGQANRSARQRMRPDGTLRQPRPPRGLILATGEDSPLGESLNARILKIDLPLDTVNFGVLTECQAAAAEGLFAQAMSGFLRWLANHYDAVQEHWSDDLRQLRSSFTREDGHRRTFENMASVALGWAYFLRFLADSELLPEVVVQRLWDWVLELLDERARLHAENIASSDPTERYLSLLREALASGRAHVASINGDMPEDPGVWGWKQEEGRPTDAGRSPQGTRIGWLDGDEVYLLPNVAYSVAKALSDAIGNPLPVTERTLRKHLSESGMLSASENRETYAVRHTCEGARQSVLALKKDHLFPTDEAEKGLEIAEKKGETANWSGLSDHWSGPKTGPNHDNCLSSNKLENYGQVGQVISSIDALDLETQQHSPVTPPISESSSEADGERVTEVF